LILFILSSIISIIKIMREGIKCLSQNKEILGI